MKTCKRGLHQYEGMWCKECKRDANAKRRAENPKVRAAEAQYQANNRESNRARCAKYRAENPEKVREYNDNAAKRRKENPEKFRAADAKRRAENRETLRIKESNRRKENPEKYRAAAAKRRKENPEKFRTANAQYRAENPEKVREYNDNAAKRRKENPEKFRAADAKRRKENPEKFRAADAKRRKENPEYFAKWWAENQDKKIMYSALRRARKRKTPFQIRNCPQYLAMHTVARWLRRKGDNVQVDHYIPLARGGPDCYENLRIVTKTENQKKGARMPADAVAFLARLRRRLLKKGHRLP